jgi:hypothetical protein
MKNNAEKVVAAFDKVLGNCNALGGMYNPSKESLKVTALTSLLTSAQESLKAVDNAKADLITAINARQKVFHPLASIGTRILNAVQVTDASPQLIADIKLYRDRFRKTVSRSSKVPKVKPEDSSKAQPISADSSRGPLSHLDFESKITNFGMMIELLKKDGNYGPNEADISIAALTAYYKMLTEHNKAVHDAKVRLNRARLVRREMVYGEKGVNKTRIAVKKYILSVFGGTHPEYIAIRSINTKSL